MRWSSAVSDAPSFSEAVGQVSEQVLDGLDGEQPDIAIAFVSSHHAPSYFTAPEVFEQRLGARVFIGCSAAAVIGGGREIERRPGVAVSAAHLPNIGVTPFEIRQDELPDPDAPPEAWRNLLGPEVEDPRAILLLPDPFTLRSDHLLAGLDFAYPHAVKIGGLVSGGTTPGSNALFSGSRVRRSGAVGVAFSGDLAVETVVAQGCRPIGKPSVVTGAHHNIITGLNGEPPLEILRDLFDKADQREKRLIRRSLQIGIAMDRLTNDFAPGDFLIRNVIGADEQDGSLAVGEMVQEGQVIQFQVRDAEAADHDLRAMLERYVEKLDGSTPVSALLFTCLGRGQYLFGAPDHDTGMFRDLVAQIPLTGFFSNGEIGPIGDQTYLHGYTSSFVLFKQGAEPRREPEAV